VVARVDLGRTHLAAPPDSGPLDGSADDRHRTGGWSLAILILFDLLALPVVFFVAKLGADSCTAVDPSAYCSAPGTATWLAVPPVLAVLGLVLAVQAQVRRRHSARRGHRLAWFATVVGVTVPFVLVLNG
jgi:peptidoglycan/LPS O-acetylase OafA/YrhL